VVGSPVSVRIVAVLVIALLFGGISSCSSSSKGAEVVTHPAAADVNSIGHAFSEWEQLPTTCPGEIIAGTLRIATVTGTGDSWATANFEAGPTCSESLAPGKPGEAPRPIPVSEIWPWGEKIQPVVAVFQKTSTEPWRMNGEAGSINGKRVFPCSVGPGGTAPGFGNGAIPADVLSAWGWHASSAGTCSRLGYPLAPQ
jgi:hypothetical protein